MRGRLSSSASSGFLLPERRHLTELSKTVPRSSTNLVHYAPSLNKETPMKYVKMMGLAALAALALTAVIGAGTASAKICSTEGTGEACGGTHGKVYTGEIHAVNETNAVLTSGFITVTCTTSTIQGTVTGATTSGNITAVTFSGCSANTGGTCTAKTTASEANKYPAKAFHGAAAPNANMTVTNVTGEFTCTVFGSTVVCKYTATDAGGANEILIKGSDTAPTVEATSVKLTKDEGSSGLCSSTATWTAKYSVTTPKSLVVT
jgi:hypothetical protein